MSSTMTRRVTRSSVKTASLENSNNKEPEQLKSTKTRALKCSPVLKKSETADIYEFEADPNEPKAFKKKRHQSRKPKQAVPRTRAKRAAPPTPPRTVTTRSTAGPSVDKSRTKLHKNTLCETAAEPETEVCSPLKQRRVQVVSDKKDSATVPHPQSSSTPMKPVQDKNCPPVGDIPENFNISLEDPGVCSVMDNYPIAAFDLSHDTPSDISNSSVSIRLPESSSGFPLECQMKAQSTPLRPTVAKNTSSRIPFSPINRDPVLPRPLAKLNPGGYAKPARLDPADLRKLRAAKDNAKPKHADKNRSLLIECAIETEGVQSPVKAPAEDVPVECPRSPKVHFSRPARRSYSSRPKAQRQIFNDEESESEDEARPTKRKNKTKKKEKGKDPQYDQWLSQMKDHFDDVENHTLVCE